MVSGVENQLVAIRELCVKYNVKRLELFGSASGDNFTPKHSDIDFIVEFKPGVDLGPWLAHYFDFQHDLEELLGRKVDLVMLSALKNPFFIREVNKTRRLLYAA